MLFSLFLALLFSDTLVLPEEIYRVTQVKAYRDSYIVLNADERRVYRLAGQTLKIVASHGRKGDGPGEWQRAFAMDVFDDKVYVCDRVAHKITVLNAADLTWIKDVKGFTTESLVVNQSGLFLVKYDQGSHTMIQHVRHFQEVRRFGLPMAPEDKLFPVQIGLLSQYEDLLFYIPSVRLAISVYDRGGKLVDQIDPPPGANHDFVGHCDLSDPNWISRCRFSTVRSFYHDRDGNLYVQINSTVTNRQTTLRYDMNKGEWRGAILGTAFFLNETLYELVEQGDHLALKPANRTFLPPGSKSSPQNQ